MVDARSSFAYTAKHSKQLEPQVEQVDTRSFEQMVAEQPQMTELENLENIYCELHKDVYGVKARWYRAESVEQARKDLERLEQEAKAQAAQDKIFQQEAIAAFMQVVNEHCQGDFEKAKRWQHQAYGTEGDDDYLAYRLGLHYGYFKQAV